jgi:FtsP/CotA-like multicopper oxidase with cupredoxin domain
VPRNLTSQLHAGFSSVPFYKPAIVTFAVALLTQSGPTQAKDTPELIQPPVCSAATVGKFPELEGLCEVTPRDDGRPGDKVKVNLTVNTGPIEVGGYRVVTEHYNNAYLPPVVRARPGDVVAAELVNLLAPREKACVHDTDHKRPCENPTNLHYFHGGIVSPQNSRRDNIDAGAGKGEDNVTGDNVYVHLANGIDAQGKVRRFNFNVPIPGEGELDARVLESDGPATIAHPPGLNWYHSHLHGVSSDQVMGGMTGLLSVGEDDANVKAACRKDPSASDQCLNAVAQETSELKWKTEVRYALLRDIMLRNIEEVPESADGASAIWAPERRDFPPQGDPPGPNQCAVWRKGSSQGDNDKTLRKGYCQPEHDTAWLFTLNGQRFPTITIEGNRNLLLRLGNLSANVAYWLELYNEKDEVPKPLTILALDGVVPAKPVPPDAGTKPVLADKVPDLLLMPASRVEIYVRNDVELHEDEQVYILRTKGLNAGTDWWPEIQLARIVLKRNQAQSKIVTGLNAPIEKPRSIATRQIPSIPTREVFPFAVEKGPAIEPERRPAGCVRDLNDVTKEHRRVTFYRIRDEKLDTDWSIRTEIRQPPPGSGPVDEEHFRSDAVIKRIPFEAYKNNNGTIDWTGERNEHVCIRLDPGGNSHKQLWVLYNNTDALHNFHIHQMKFRLAKASELCARRIQPPAESQTCPQEGECDQPNQKLYVNDLEIDDRGLPKCPETVASIAADKNPKISDREWHDTIPMPPDGSKVFLIMSFDDANQQIGRFVFHCHILKHEDKGLMAPIEVWDAADLD